MSTAEKLPVSLWPDHTQLPDSDGEVSENLQELPQSSLLRDSIRPVLDAIHPDGRYAIGGNANIYWKFTDSPLKGCKAPDWFYVPGVDPVMADGARRRSYVLWREHVPPMIVLEYVSGDGSDERDTTPDSGKFWVYERAIRANYYGIFDVDPDRLDVFELVDGLYRPMTPNRRGNYPIPEMQVELGFWRGYVHNDSGTWIRWFDPEGNLLLSGHETAARNAEVAARNAEVAAREFDRAERLAAQLRALGIEPEA